MEKLGRPLNISEKKIKKVVGKLLFYERSIDKTMLVAINAIAVAKKFGLRKTMKILSTLNQTFIQKSKLMSYNRLMMTMMKVNMEI